MNDLHVTNFQAHYRLSNQNDCRKRVQSIQQSLLDYHLEAATANLGIQSDEIVCIRKVFVPLQINQYQTDYDAAQQWSELITRELQRALFGDSDFEVWRFRHRLDAITQFSTDIKNGHTHRDWVWRQLEFLYPSFSGTSHNERIEALLRLLIQESILIIPLLRIFALSEMLSWFARQLREENVQLCLQTAMTAVASPINVERLLLEVSLPARNFQEVEKLTQHLNFEFVQAFLSIIHQSESASIQKLWSTIGAVVSYPHIFQREVKLLPSLITHLWQTAIGQNYYASTYESTLEEARPAISDRIRATLTSADPDLNQPHTSDLEQKFAATNSDLNDSDLNDSDLNDSDLDNSDLDNSDLDNSDLDNSDLNNSDLDSSNVEPSGLLIRAPAIQSQQKQELPYRTQGITNYGGLLFLLPLVESSGGIELLLSESSLAETSLPEVLHRLSLNLYPLSPHDPAALAFAGMMPQQALPYDLECELSENQTNILEAATTLVISSLAERLPKWHRASLMQRVVERDAMIVADPGWFEIHFRLIDVSVDIRRVALDLDPGFIPWLGVVIKYVYE